RRTVLTPSHLADARCHRVRANRIRVLERTPLRRNSALGRDRDAATKNFDNRQETQQVNFGRAIPAARDQSSPFSHSRRMLENQFLFRMLLPGQDRTSLCDPYRTVRGKKTPGLPRVNPVEPKSKHEKTSTPFRHWREGIRVSLRAGFQWTR